MMSGGPVLPGASFRAPRRLLDEFVPLDGGHQGRIWSGLPLRGKAPIESEPRIAPWSLPSGFRSALQCCKCVRSSFASRTSDGQRPPSIPAMVLYSAEHPGHDPPCAGWPAAHSPRQGRGTSTRSLRAHRSVLESPACFRARRWRKVAQWRGNGTKNLLRLGSSVWDNWRMGSSGDKPRKFRRRMEKVPRAEEVTNIHLAGLGESSSGVSGTRLGHETAHGRSQDIGTVGKFVLWCLGRRPKEPQPERGPDQESGHEQ